MGRKYRNLRKRLRKRKNKGLHTKIERQVAQFLHDLGISYKANSRVHRYNVDFLIHDKYIVECYGDYWHCNPEKYSPDYYNRGLKCEARDRWARDRARREELEALGFKMLELWEHAIQSNPKHCKTRITSFLNSG